MGKSCKEIAGDLEEMRSTKSIWKYLLKTINLIEEGNTLKDKIKIFLWLSFNIQKNLILKNKDGIFFVRGKSADLWMMSPMGEEEIRKYFDLEEGIFLDIGANVGKYSIMLGKQMGAKGRVLAFEPEPNNIKSLKKNIELNRVNNIDIIGKACSSSRGEVNFYLSSDNTGGHSITAKTNNKITVQSDTLDNILKENKISRVDLAKIDVEGAEYFVLKGARMMLEKFNPKIIFESWVGANHNKAIALLESFGYEIKKISKNDYFATQKK